jgi:tyrosyl-tRNA synthetase
MKMSNVKFLWASDEINARSNEYWLRVMDIARKNTLTRIKRCATIMGRKEEDEFSVAQALYPCMQCSDIFFLKADICQLGLDQRKVNMLAREYCDDIGQKDKPIILSHHMMMGLVEGQAKMSKSNPDSAIFMEDDEKTVKDKIKKAFCPPGQVADNPVLNYCKHIIFGWYKQLHITRKPANGGDVTYSTYEELEKDYAEGKLHPGDLKPAVSDLLNKILQPVRDHFATNSEAKRLLERVRSYAVTK